MKKLFNHTKRPDRNWEEDVQDGYDWDEEQDGEEYYADDEEYTDEEYTGEEDGEEYYADDEEYTGEEDGERDQTDWCMEKLNERKVPAMAFFHMPSFA